MANFRVCAVDSDKHGNINFADLSEKVERFKDELGAIMITYPSTHGVFESSIVDVCKKIHDNGGQVYLDGANFNAQVFIGFFENPVEFLRSSGGTLSTRRLR